MSPALSTIESRPGALGRPLEGEKRDWTVVVARYARDDWPPPM